ncbi:hypothetical protein A3K63_03900 [Candidatus Micrarchaeota archaeon RBG_16_49_10]|nr:MAG: hypothetical protein A3K63_03900 [Candidatus Micrarchaeota archaeon RBG_16_49_10]
MEACEHRQFGEGQTRRVGRKDFKNLPSRICLRKCPPHLYTTLYNTIVQDTVSIDIIQTQMKMQVVERRVLKNT